MRRLLAMVAMFAASACASAEMAAPDAAKADARIGTPDATENPDAPPHIDAPPAPDASPSSPDAAPPTAARLLLSEVSLAPTGGELIEIVNPGATAVALDHYYLTDAPTYYLLPSGTQTIDSSDFIAHFPAGATIAAGAVITVSVDTVANFTTAYGAAPTYALSSGTMVHVGSGTQTLTNTGEPVVLFYWDGATDLITDCDIVIAGNPTAGNALVDKSSVAIDGPDADAVTTAYATDARTIPTTTAPGSALSIKRLLPETGHETQDGSGNGVGGDDETSEQIGATWDSTYTAPTPGSSPL